MMNPFRRYIVLASTILLLASACNRSGVEENTDASKILKGLYSFGPEIKSFTDCEEGKEYWVTDSAKTLELAYSNFNFEKPYEPVYIEVECHMIKSDSLMISADFDSTMVVTKVLKITKEIPDGPCN
jgi:copper homeostasis protein (lipoprotein)